MADPRNLLNAYQQQLASRGLGSVFQLEGPEQVGGGISMASPFAKMSAQEALDAGVSPAALRELGTQRQRAANIDTARTPVEADIFSADTLDLLRSYTPEASPMGNLLKKAAMKKDAEGVASKLAARSEGMTTLESLEADMADAAAAKEELAPKPKSLSAEGFRAEEQKRAEMAGMDTKGTMVDNAFMAAMKEYNKASGKEEDTTDLSEADLMEKYKKEFADATGIDVSGKVDKSQALMAFGLALMQNRAGKGFNVGRMLSEVGKAGEAAMPKLEAARQEAKAAQLAAGKYALGRLQAGRDARAALQLEQTKFMQEAFLKQMELDAEAAKDAAKGTEIKNVTDIEVMPNLKIRRGTSGGNGIFVDGTETANKLVKGYNTSYNALDSISQMEQAVMDVANSPSPTLTLVTDRFNSILVGAGLKDPKVTFGKEGLSPEAQRTAIKDSLLTEFKRMLTQETGNGISNVDMERIDAAFGNLDLFGNPQEAIFRLNQMKAIFTGKIDALDSYIDLTFQPDQFATEAEFNRAQSILNKGIGVRGGFTVNTDGGTATIDLTK